MGALMRAKDWSQTPLGPLEAWPQSLRTAVSVMLASPQPSYIFWGPALAILYNQRGLPFVGEKHPGCLGQTIREVLKEAWPVLGPLVEGVMRSGEAVHLEDLLIPLVRVGFLQHGYFTFSYVPILDEQAAVGGILVLVNETTRQVVGARRLALIRELSLRAALCQTVPAVLRASERVLAGAPIDVPFALVYELKGGQAALAVCAGLAPGSPEAPLELRVAADAGGWPILEVAREKQERLLEDLAARFPGLPHPPEAGPPARALLLPLSAEAGGEATHVLVAALNPHYLFDGEANSFLHLLGRQLVTSVASVRALEEKTERAAQLAELDRQKTEFFSNVSHEFRTPLTLMLGPVEDALEKQGELSAEPLASVHRNALRLLKLVNNLLDFSRAEAGRARAAFRPLDLARHTTDLASGFRSAIEGAGLRFEIACPPAEAPAVVDAEMWEKIVLNLLSNAFKFTFAGRIEIALAQGADEAKLTVTDTGVGIPAEELPRLFDRFHRVQGARSRSYEGSGIGLALVAEMARLHGGRVEVESRLGEGTRFTVTVPRQSAAQLEALPPPGAPEEIGGRPPAHATRAAYVEEAARWLPPAIPDAPLARGTPPGEAGEPAERQATKTPGAAPRGRARGRILVADDNADMRDYLARLLGERWTVETACDGGEALAKAQRSPPDAIVSDLMMPILDGLQLVRELRADRRTHEVPFLLLSARADQQSTTEALAAGATDYLIKPFSSRELVARVRAHLEIAAIQRAARERLESFLMDAPAAIAVLRGPSLVFVLANKRYEELVGRGRLVGHAGRAALPELVGQGVWELVDRVYRTGEPYLANAFPALIARGAQGALEEGFFNWSAQPTRDLDGAIDGVMLFAIDVTEQARARLQLERASAVEQSLRSEAVAANRAKDEFLAMLGHELRNPLAPIGTALELMRLRGAPQAERELQVIERQVRHLERLVGDLLDVSRIAQGKIELEREPLEIARALGDAAEMSEALIEARGHRLELRAPKLGLAVLGDLGRLKQVFANLIINAAKYTEPGGELRVEAERQGASVVVRVRDNGVGLSPAMLPRVFELFSQVPQSLARSQGGLGLGLSIVRSIVALHGGSVRAESEGEGKGSTFVVELPAASEEARVARRAPSPRPGVLQPALSPKRVLIVDDNADAALLLAEVLEAAGHVTAVAHDGAGALALAPGFQPEVAVLDIGLPGMDGYELARRLRGEPALSRVRIIAITGYGQRADRERSRAAGFDAHLVKPVQFELLARALADP